MFIINSLLLILFGQLFAENALNKDPSVFITILARNKAHTLPYFLSLLAEQDYPKDRISLWIRSDHNQDNTVDILKTWLNVVAKDYHSVDVMEDFGASRGFADETGPTHWSQQRFLHVIGLREQALNAAREKWADFILFVDCDVFLTNRRTLRVLIRKEYTVVAPMLKSSGMYSNFWCGMTADYYYLRTDEYQPILKFNNRGCFSVPMVHSAVLINLNRRESDHLSFNSSKVQGYSGPTDDIITFAVVANLSGISLHVCNEETFGYLMVPLEQGDSLSQDAAQLTNLKLDVLIEEPPLFVTPLLQPYVPVAHMDRMGFDVIYMINLLRRPERRTRMLNNFRELGFDVTVTDAVDGRTLNTSQLDALGIKMMQGYLDPYHKRPMTHGEIGCFLSHYNIWKQIVDEEQEAVMVLEDDVRFEPFFRQKVITVLQEATALNLQWDFIYLGRQRQRDTEQWVQGSAHLVHVTYSYWTVGYLLTLQGARKLLRAQPLQTLLPVDEFLPIMFGVHPEEEWNKHFPVRDVEAYSVAPLLVFPTHYTGDDGYISDTENSQTIAEDQHTTLRPKEDL